MSAKELFRKLPKVDILLQNEVIAGLCEEYGRGFVVECIRAELDHARALIAAESSETEAYLNNFVKNVEKRVELESEYPLKKVINATGIILHTNLGRAPLGKIHLDAINQAIGGYSNLEYDLETGKRGKRFTHYADLITKITYLKNAVLYVEAKGKLDIYNAQDYLDEIKDSLSKKYIKELVLEFSGISYVASIGLRVILELYKNSSIVDDSEFQRKFNAFYRVRRGAEWRAVFYEIFAREKGSTPSFDTILNEIYQRTGNIEGSFTSKLLATINPNLPIWDQYVLKNLNLKMPICKGERKIQSAIGISVDVTLVEPESLPRSEGKAIRVIDERNFD